jgi:signal transduction histidine kinase
VRWFPRPGRADREALEHRIAGLEDDNARLLESLGGIQQRFRRLARAVWRVQEDERRRLARDLHDDLGQTLTALRHRLERLPPGESREAALELAAQALDDVRELSRLLRPPVLDDLGLSAGLNWLGRRVRENSGLPVRVSASLDVPLDPETETLLFRIAQEALTNAVRHADATRVNLSLCRVADRLELRVHDNGKGFEPSVLEDTGETGVGLAGMRDRVALFGGELVISSAEGRGTTVSATLFLSKGTTGDGGR